MSVDMLGCLPGPVSPYRANRPHPRQDFLLPTNIVKMDEQQKFQSHVQSAVKDYLGKLYQNGHYTSPQLSEIVRKTLGEGALRQSAIQPPDVNTPTMGESEMMENYVNPTEDALEKIIKDDQALLKREQGNSDKQAGKVYHDIADQKEHLEILRSDSREHYNPLYQRISRTPQLGSDNHKAHWLHWPRAHPPTPGKRGLHENLTAPCQVKYTQPKSALMASVRKSYPTAATSGSAKRVHTPPTPPDRSSRRVKSAIYSAEVHNNMRRAQSLPPTPRSKSASPPLLEKRPKTAGPQLAKSMAMHPRMQAWIESATSYEKEVALSMLSTLSGRKPTDEEFQKLEAKLNCTPTKPKAGQAASKTRKTWAAPVNKPTIPPTTHTFNAYIPPSPAPVKAVPNRHGKGDHTTKEWMKKIEDTINDRVTPQEFDRTTIQVLPRGSRPLARHQPRPKILDDYRHDNSFFNFTKKSATGQFTIAPDWVSERLKQRRRPPKASKEQLRYGSQ
ncbi:uncharacterized protein [Amphiura filiformis]|uniref:uncharacterized protein isoform X2 n=1 Tax=Amphiura filiformis TaxID=82378 RepID=UPI003B224890